MMANLISYNNHNDSTTNLKNCHSHKFKAYAKLNLGLKFVGKRPDGYHLLKTIFCLIDLYDEIEIYTNKLSNEIKLLNHNYPWPETSDLAYKAAKLLQQHTNTSYGVTIEIKKNIPHGGGMGGGSSDAATVLVELNKLWNINLPQAELIKLGVTLGADVPFFIFGKNAYAEGIGEVLSEIILEEKYFIIILPGIYISTKSVFDNLILGINEQNSITNEYLLKTLENDLEPVARQIYPQLETIFQDLKKHGNPVMTGSGSTIYLPYQSLNEAKKVADNIKNTYNHYLVRSLSAR